ncbi:DinB family protein [Flavobacterium sp.]|uniref:DinB family protein n=1 Tax=Flavobacterium sp. TaxID=239 RepID=UPI00286DE123|nr:DinB family protein [Flavobacterium sp.]
MIIKSINHCLKQVKDLLIQIEDKDYTIRCSELSNASIGEHIRHIIEMFQCLTNEYKSGIVNYDKRERNKFLEMDANFASNQIDLLLNNIDKPNKEFLLQQNGMDEIISINTNYYRELVYNLEHCIHHQALIKIGLMLNFDYKIDKNFGVAFSTIEYRNRNK